MNGFAHVVADNTIKEVVYAALTANVSFSKVADNVIHDAEHGIRMDQASYSQVSGNELRKCGMFGIYVKGDSNWFVWNYARTQEGGVDLYDSITAQGNAFLHNDVVTSNV